jgi:hypothetical protein
MWDITPSMKIGSFEECQRATFSVRYVTEPTWATVIIARGGCVMVPDEATAREVLLLLGCDDAHIEYLFTPMAVTPSPGNAGVNSAGQILPEPDLLENLILGLSSTLDD